jgi:hypothetical protein
VSDPSIHIYISQRKTFDTGYWYDYNDGFMLLPHNRGRWLEDKIWFPTIGELLEFCKACECTVIKYED